MPSLVGSEMCIRDRHWLKSEINAFLKSEGIARDEHGYNVDLVNNSLARYFNSNPNSSLNVSLVRELNEATCLWIFLLRLGAFESTLSP